MLFVFAKPVAKGLPYARAEDSRLIASSFSVSIAVSAEESARMCLYFESQRVYVRCRCFHMVAATRRSDETLILRATLLVQLFA